FEVFVSILDAPEVPYFIKQTVNLAGQVPENEPSSTTILVLADFARDDDTYDRGNLKFSLSPSSPNADLFMASAHHGVVTAREPFDYEAISTYQLRVRVTDSTGLVAESDVDIAVRDVPESPQL